MFFKYIRKNAIRIIILIITLIILSIISLLPGLITQEIIDEGFIKMKLDTIVILSIILGGLYIIKSVLNYITNKMFIDIGQNLCLELKSDIFSRLLRFPLEFFSDKDSGYIKSRVNEIDSVLQLFTPQTFKVIFSILEFFISLIILIKLNSRVIIFMCIPIPIFYIISKVSMNRYRDKSNIFIEHSAKYSGKINESLQGIEEIKILATEEHEENKINNYNKKLVKLSINQSNMLNFITEILGLLTSIVTVLAFIVCGYEVVNKRLSIGGVTAVTMYVGKLYSPVMMISSSSITIQPALISLKRIYEMFYKDIDINKNKLELISNINSININNLSFKYKSRENFILNKLNLKLNKGDILIIKGANGTGKTTLIKLILKLYDDYSGSILINNKSLKEIDDMSIKENISIVSQKVFLFNDSIKNNILYGIKCNVTEEKYRYVLKVVNLEDFIKSLPMGDETIIGERGLSLSGGQIQKIAIARALIKDSDVCIYDEASSNIDTYGKKALKSIIKNNNENKINILIEHSDYYDDIGTKIIEFNNNDLMKEGI